MVALIILLLAGVWAALMTLGNRRKRERESAEERWAEMTTRVHALELAIKEMRAESARRAPASATPSAAQAPPAAAKVAKVSPELPSLAAALTVVPAPVAEVAPPPFTLREPIAGLPIVAANPALPEPARPRGFDLEEALGANWLNKIGVVILVTGVALFLVYQLRQVGPAGKILVGLAVSAGLLGGGIALEKRSAYRIIGRALIGGGWALGFFTAYAMYHVEATRILSSQMPDLALMLLVASGMVAHTLRYRSQVVTGLAFLLAFSTLTISQVTVYSLSAEIILAAGLVVIVWRMKWFELEICGIAAAYLTHWWWVRRIVEPMGTHMHAFPEFLPSAAILAFYWALFRVSYMFRECDGREERISTGAALLNSVGLLAVLKYQSVHPEWAFWALLALGAAELGMGLLPVTRRRRAAFLILATIGVALLLAAIPFRFTGGALDALWIFEAEALLAAGIAVREVLYRRLGMLAAVLVAMDVLYSTAAPLAGLRFDRMAYLPDFRVAMLCFAPALVLFGNAHFATRRWPALFEHVVDRKVMHCFSFAGAFLLYVSLWAAFPGMRTAPAWAAAGLALLLAGNWMKIEQLPLEAHFYFVSAMIIALSVNLPNDALGSDGAARLATVSFVAALSYGASRWGAGGLETWPQIAGAMPAAYRWAATVLLLLLVYYGLNAVSGSPACVLLGLLLLETGLLLGLKDLRMQGYAALGVAFAAIFFVNLNAEAPGAGLSPRLYTTMPVVLALYYVYVRISSLTEAFEARFSVANTAAWCGTIAFAALLRFELSPDWVAAAWAANASALLAVAWMVRRPTFLYQGLFLCFAATGRASLHNLYERSYLPGPLWSSRAVSTGAAIALLLAGLWMAFRLRNPEKPVDSQGWVRMFLSVCVRRPEQVFFFAPLALLVTLLALEMRSGMITVSWSALGVLVFLFALGVGERSFRLAGLALLLLGVGKIGVVDVWSLNPRDRYVTRICMGSALLLVSFLYSRYQEAIRKYL